MGPAVKPIPVEAVTHLKSNEKHTLVVRPRGKALTRQPLRKLGEALGGARYRPVHRAR